MNNSSHQQASALHQALIDQLKQNIPEFILTSKIEEAFRAVPRHLFLPDLPLDQVYRDDAIVTKSDFHAASGADSIFCVRRPASERISLSKAILSQIKS